jgi:hypothetical protein
MESNKAADDHSKASDVVTRFHAFLEDSHASLSAEERALYKEAVSLPVEADGMEMLHLRLERIRQTRAELARDLSEFEAAEKTARVAAADARLKHARLMRAKKKWEALINRFEEKMLEEEMHKEELHLEEMISKPVRS